MMQPPSLNHSTPSTAPVPRYRRWAAYLALVVAGIGSVATSPPSSPMVSSEYEGSPLTITTQAPTTTRHLKVRVTAEDYSFDRAEVSVTAQVTARWTPADPSHTEKPWLLTRLYVPSEDYSGPGPGHGQVLVLGEPGQPVSLQTYTGGTSECKPDQGCEWTVPLEFELQPNATEGSVEVEWKVTAEAYVEGTNDLPKGFTVQVSEQ
ncbi:hypothetical protein [Cystobacter fuscus]|uniref:hypothetical protein n=1 Tax=Cystobacter fuscus TaxID=43 RepID=UPI002B27E481|nr:hypothetical protein F0U63_05690 [Cystobacter fuscus]